MTLWTGLLANVAVLMTVVCIWSNARPRLFSSTSVQGQAAFGCLSGCAVAAVMNMGVPFADGVFVDLRASVVTVAALFGGPISAAVTVLASISYRLYMGGAGAPVGMLAIFSAGAVGLIGHYVSQRGHPNWPRLLQIAVAASAANALCLLLLPTAIAAVILRTAAAPLMFLNATVTFVAGVMMLNELRRRDLAQTNYLYRMAINSFPDCLNVKDAEGRFLLANEATARLMNADSAAALIGKTDADFYPPEVARQVMEEEREAITKAVPTEIEQKVGHPGKPDIWLSTLKVPVLANDGSLAGIITHNRDVTEKHKLTTELATSRQHLEDAIENMPGGVAMFSSEGMLVYCNTHYSEMFPLTADLRVPGVNYRDMLKGARDRGEFMALPASLEEDLALSPQDLLLSRDKKQSQLSDGRWIETHVRFTLAGACFFLCNDITRLKSKEAKLVELNAKLSTAAITDGLTGLANRRAFDEYLNHELKRSSRGSLPLSLVMIDIDRFKAFNDTYGHPSGDECIKVVAECLQEVVGRPSDMAARYGGEEMALILPLTDSGGAEELAERLRQLVRERKIPHIGSEKGIVTVSIGVTALQPGDTTDITPAQFVRRADDALYQAKRNGRDIVCTYGSGKMRRAAS